MHCLSASFIRLWTLDYELIVGSVGIFSFLLCLFVFLYRYFFSVFIFGIKFYLLDSSIALIPVSLELTVGTAWSYGWEPSKSSPKLVSSWARVQCHSSLSPPKNLGQCLVSSRENLFTVNWFICPRGPASFIRPLLHASFLNHLFACFPPKLFVCVLKTQFPSFLSLNNISFYSYITFPLLIHHWTFRLLPHLGYCE